MIESISLNSVIEKFDVNLARFHPAHILRAMGVVLECCFGMHIGAVIGWLLGWYMGSVYVEHFEPVSILDLNEVMRWYLMPSTFAENGIFAGALAGMIVMAALAIKQNVSK